MNETLKIPGDHVRDFSILAELRYPGEGMQAAHSWDWQEEMRKVLDDNLAANEDRLLAYSERTA